MNESIEQLIKTLKRAVDQMTQELASQVAEAVSRREFDRAAKLTEKWQSLKELQFKVSELSTEWRNLSSAGNCSLNKTETAGGSWKLPDGFELKVSRKKRVSSGEEGKTPELDFAIPILEAVVELGGSAPVSEVLDLVFQKMRGVLKRGDLKPLECNPQIPRWRNAAHWCRLQLVHRGLLKGNTPRGIWEITDEGRRYYLAQKGRAS